MTQNTAYLRCDTLGVLFSACAVVMVGKSRDHRLPIVLAAILGMLAFATKQHFVASTASCALYLFLKNRKLGMLFIGASVFLYGAFAIFAQAAWAVGTGSAPMLPFLSILEVSHTQFPILKR